MTCRSVLESSPTKIHCHQLHFPLSPHFPLWATLLATCVFDQTSVSVPVSLVKKACSCKQMCLRACHLLFLIKRPSHNLQNQFAAFPTLIPHPGIYHRRLIHQIAQSILREGFLSTFKVQELANTAWALARVGHQDARLMDAIAQQAMEPGFLSTCKAQEISNLAWAFATVGIQNDSLMASIDP